MNAIAQDVVKGSLNFAADRSDGGIWSNGDPSRVTQKLDSHRVEVRDARRLAAPPSLEREGFEVRRATIGGARWGDADWTATVYEPHAAELVRQATGAAYVGSFGTMIRDSAQNRETGGDAGRAKPADFVHLDQTREAILPMAGRLTPPEALRQWPRVKVFNVWRALTPPPQDVPLAICDQRTLDEADWVVGMTVEPGLPQGMPYVTTVFNPGLRWYYVADLTPDDAVIFKGADADPAAPMGCLHGAFQHAEPPAGAVPRASIETRVVALFPE